MGLLGAIRLSIALVSLTQIPFSRAACPITSAVSAGPSAILVKWEADPVATNYILDLRVVNDSNYAPVLAIVPKTQTEKKVQGLQPGTNYTVTLKVLQFMTVECFSKTQACTVPDTAQITSGVALLSTSIALKWTQVPSAAHYYLVILTQGTGAKLNLTYTTHSAVVGNLHPSTNYDCYVYSANSAGVGYASKVRTITTLVQPPVGIKAVQTGRNEADLSWLPVDNVLIYLVTIQKAKEPAAVPAVYNVTDTILHLNNIQPCSQYLINISSYNMFLVPGEPNVYSYTTNTLNPVSTVSVDYYCSTDSVKVIWMPVQGADSYKAQAIAEGDAPLLCTGSHSSCVISGVSCGKTYEVHVTPISANCENQVNSTYATFHSVPCPPQNLSLLRSCNTEVIVFSWGATDNTQIYKAKAIDSKGVVQECVTEDNSCYFTHTSCGRHYYFSVYSMSDSCNSKQSETVNISTAPCIPQNMKTIADCNSNALVSMWDLAEGALYYTVEAYGNVGNNDHYNCTTQSGSCSFENMTCGQSLSMYITSHDEHCSSPRALAPVAETVPCVPGNVVASTDCEEKSITVSWDMAGGAVYYIAVAVDSNGNLHSCYSLDLICIIEDLSCSTNYTVSVMSSNIICNSSQSDTVVIETVACPPSNIIATLDCVKNEALISWTAEPRIKSFTATALDENAGLLSCSSTTTSCIINELQCDQRYHVTVGNHDGVCPIINSDLIYMYSVPCGPAVTAEVDCGTQVITATWGAVTNAASYEVQLSDETGEQEFSVTDPAFTSSSLECGKTYTLGVRSVIDGCISHATQVTVTQAPCAPTNILAQTVCPQTHAQIAWESSLGAVSYEVTAVSSGAPQMQCNSSDTNCQLEDLVCGQTYSVTATALDDQCYSETSAETLLKTEPCPPTGLVVSVDCASNSAVLSWDSTPNAVSYSAKAVSPSQPTVTCEAGAGLSCNLEDLQCGQSYSFTVTASDGNCESAESEAVTYSTAPCAVTSVTNTVDCVSNSLTTSWISVAPSLNYTVKAEVSDGSMLWCETDQSSCVLYNLPCGEQYNVTVIPTSSTCTGQSTEPEVVNTAPCVATNIITNIQCSDNSLHSSWDMAIGATSYIATLSGDDGSSLTCPSFNGFCSFNSLECAQTYTLNVTGSNDRCDNSTSVTVQTAPCDPTNVTASLDCASGVATVSWTASAGAEYYTVLAQVNDHEDTCTSTSTSCELHHLRCGQEYAVIVLAGDDACNSTVRTTLKIITAPCTPVLKEFSLDCSSNVAVVPWVKDKHAQSVTVTAVSSLSHSTSCSSSNDSSCALSDLQCGHTYTVTVVAQGIQCASEPSAPFEIITAPCTPENLDFTNSCETGIAIVSWDETLGRKSFYITATATNMKTYSTGTTSCSISSMVCGQLYDINVFAIADHCNSSVPASTQIETAPCAPQDVTASLLCENNTASVSWTASAGAVSYTVKAFSRGGDMKTCSASNTTTTCEIPNMQCGETYRITVTPFSESCQGYDSLEIDYVAGPCPPTDFTVSRQCTGNVAVVSWTPVPNAEYYEASALEIITPHTHNCSSNSTTCSIRDLHCGETVAVTVLTKERGCWSKPNQPFMFETVICPPTGLTTATTCSNNDITVSWDPSPNSGVAYNLDSTKFGGTSQQYSTSSTSYVMTGLQCGELYILKASAQYQECTSTFSHTVEAQTAPCPPTDLSVTTDCGTGSATLTWTQSIRATHYTATFTGDHGNVTTCTSNSTTCTVKLDCGQDYTASLIASSATCDSSSAATLVFTSAPCLPDNVVATLDCISNSFAVSWNGNPRDGPFKAQAIGSDSSRVSCNSSNNHCTINSLKCGLLYSIVVTTDKVDCGVINESDYRVRSAPCKPSDVSVGLNCDTNDAVIGWTGTGPDQEQEVIARDIRGNTISCTSPTLQCEFTGLTCGLSYNISVVGKSNICTSSPTYGPMLHTAPCLPTQVKTTFDCQTGITIVSWDAGIGATSYAVEAKGSLGHNAQCENADTNCDFARLACGQDYNITVQAQNSECISAVSETVVTTSGPCPHSDVATNLDCGANIAVVSWTPGRGTLYYNATASGLSTTSTETCSTNSSSCNITTLICGERYSISVKGQGLTCPSPAQTWENVQAAPCPPTLLSVNSSCDSDDIVVNWATSKGAVTYMAVAENAEGQKWTCESGDTKCEITDLPCGQMFNVYVSGMDGGCIGARSNVKAIETAPCVPQQITTELYCPTGVLNVSWGIMGIMPKSMEYYEIDSNGRIIICFEMNCHPSDGNCIIPDQLCGRSFDLKLKAVGTKCNSSRSAPQPITTAPCPPKSFDTVVDCASGVVSVSWVDGVVGVVYEVAAVGGDLGEHKCTSSDGGCDLDSLQCGSEYNITITPSRNGCVGVSSPPQTITTVPCVPQLKDVDIDCLTNSVWVMWTEANGAEDYVITATDTTGVQTFECNSTLDNMCILPPLACSMNFTFTVQARDSQCSSAHSNAVMAETGPCSPVNIVSKVDCEGNVISISWDTVPGAVSYTATLEDFNGKTDCCTSAQNSCDISDLPCGQMYILLVTAEGRTCNSSESRAMARTAPCVPENLDYSLSCKTNLASMSWNHSLGGQLYLVTAVSQDNYIDQCYSHENHCELRDLQCGQTYTVNVTAEDMDCSSKPSDNIFIKTAPCTPLNLSSKVDCGSSMMSISWTDSDGADSYLATVVDSYGQITSCQATTEGQCSVGALGCGLIAHVSLVASDGYCESLSTDVVDTPSVPCAPEYIKAIFDCRLNTAVVTWYPSDGAVLYVVTATAASGDTSSCQTDSTTHCELDELECGDSYSIQVLAVGETCNTTGHMSGAMETGPCAPEILSTDYSVTIGQVVWARTLGAEYYTVEAVTDQGLVSQCQTNDTYCALPLKCSQTYTVTLIANNDDQCSSGIPSNETASITTEPCPPQNFQTSVLCEVNSAAASWEPSVGAVGYTTTLSGRNGETLWCKTGETFCELQGLECGVIYYAQVVAMGDALNSTESGTVLLEAAPCPVENVIVDTDCYNGSAVLTWTPASGAVSYKMIATATSGHQVSCESNISECELEELECGQTYTVKAVSISDQCSVETDTGVIFITRPCKPHEVGVNFLCDKAMAVVFWEDEERVDMYSVTAVSSSGVISYCNSTVSPCLFTDLDCGESYDFTVEACNDACCSEPSKTVDVETGPCQPRNLTAHGSCNNDTVVLSWADAAGAVRYEVDVSGDLGYVTSSTTNITTVKINLSCGQLYTFTVQALGHACVSAVSQPVHYHTGPCVPRDVQSYTTCEDSIGTVSWGPTDGAEYYIAFAVGLDGHSAVCTTNETSCIWDDLHCGDFYTVFVTAHNDACDSPKGNSTTIRMASCIPQNLSVDFNCSMKVGHLSWDAVDTADFYIATAESNSGHKIQQTTNDTWVYFSEFLCGEEYFLSVQSVDAHCTSKPSPTAKLQSEPCPPTGVSSFMNCVANIAVVSWNSSAGADYYTATVTSEGGTSQSCWSDNEQCGIPNLRCGQNYSVSVVASNEACNSDPSKESQLMSVPCVPTNVKVSLDCSNNQATVSWDASEGALTYTVTAEGMNDTSSSCETSGLSCVLADLQCGQVYSVQVVSKDDICSSLPSPATLFDSVPCIPDMGSVMIDCVTDSFIADWMFSEGAVNYTATALSDNGGQSTCSSSHTNCELSDLQCGQTYSVSVKAENALCSSASSYAVQAKSAPCPAQGVASSLNCSTNSIHVQWQQVSGLEYLVVALGLEEDVASCPSSSDSCVLKGLECGFIYNISVIASNDVCNTSSSVIQQHSVPCIPQNVRTKFDCENKDVQVTWQSTKGAHSYRTVAQSLGGFPEVCLSNDTWCTFSQLACDMNYTFTVMASDDECSSHASDSVEIYTGPCEPQRVMADMFCHNNTGMVSWDEGEGVTSYSVHGYGPDGHAVSCNTEGTSCQLPNMHCGQTYNLTVTANDGRCNNSQTHVSLNSVPCSPTNVGVSLQCYSHIAAVTWESASGAISYKALAVSADGNHTSVCTNNETHCDLSDLQCGTVYSVTVTGLDSSCSSVESAAATVQTAPCPPENVVITEQCAGGSMTVSWSAHPGAQYFLVNGISDSNSVLDCNTTSTSCSFSSLPCGEKYNFIVLAIRGDCPSRSSSPVLTSSAPCVPTNLNGNLDCVTNSAWISWTNSDGASSYFVSAKAEGKAHNASCTSDTSHCSVPDLICGTRYNIQVTAENEHCSSTPSASFLLETAPCALTSINASTQCDSSVITVQWQMSENMPVYVATAEGHDQSLIMCNSTTSSCQLTSATCGIHYTIIVSTSSVKCSSLRSPPHKIDTAPCAPQNVKAVQSCSNNGVTVSYDLSPVASHYKVEVTGPGFNQICESTSDNCTLDGLPCGEDFEVVVYALTQNCTSPGTKISYSSGPCPPSGLTVSYDCASLSATLTWEASEGTKQYYASAWTMDYTPLYCTSTGLSCTIEGLVCGYNYSFGVEASDNVCNSSSAKPVEVGAVPCSPTNIRVRMQLIVGHFWAMISWDRVTCPNVEYQMVLAGHINDNVQTQMHITSYWLERPYFEMPLPTSSTYKINVYARNQAGVSGPSFTQTGVTVPSPPQNAVYNRATSELTWDPSTLANHYTVYMVTGNKETVLCETALLTCTAVGVDFSSLRVKATNGAGSSLPSVPTAVGARRRRDLIGAEMDFDNTLLSPSDVTVTVVGTSLTVQWQAVIDAAEYVVVIDKKIENFQSLIETTTNTNLIVTGLQPNTEYCLKVAAKNISQQSPYSQIQCIST